MTYSPRLHTIGLTSCHSSTCTMKLFDMQTVRLLGSPASGCDVGQRKRLTLRLRLLMTFVRGAGGFGKSTWSRSDVGCDNNSLQSRLASAMAIWRPTNAHDREQARDFITNVRLRHHHCSCKVYPSTKIIFLSAQGYFHKYVKHGIIFSFVVIVFFFSKLKKSVSSLRNWQNNTKANQHHSAYRCCASQHDDLLC